MSNLFNEVVNVVLGKETETLKEKQFRLASLQSELATVKRKLQDEDTTRIATLQHDGFIAAALEAERIRDKKVAALTAERERLEIEIKDLAVEINALEPACPTCGRHFPSDAVLQRHKAEARRMNNPMQCGAIV